MHKDLLKAAERLRKAEMIGQPCTPVRDLIAAAHADAPEIEPIDLAYSVQLHNNMANIVAGRRPVGCKIGLTSLAVQRQLGVDQPDFGRLFADMARSENQSIAWRDTAQPKVEAEIALVLERDLHHERHTIADLIRAVDFVLPAIEVVGSRIAGWDITLLDTVADNASSGLFVLGSHPVTLRKFDVSHCGMSMTLRGEPVSVGVGEACMGNPLNAALWLADTMVRLGEPLKAGDILLTGALGSMVSARPGDVFRAEIQGLGSVTATFGEEAGSGNS